MATNYTPERFSIQQVFELLLRDPDTKKITAYLDDCKSTGLEKTATLVYPTGGAGNAYIGGAFGHSNRAKLTVSKGTWSTSVLAVQNGTEVVTGSNKNIVKYDILKVASDKITTTFKALGTTGAEIGTVYVLNSSGSIESELVQDATVAAGKFTYTPATKLITFNTAELADDTVVAVSYVFDSGTSAKTISVDVDKFPSTQLVTGFGLVKDLCTGVLYQMEINGMGQIDPNWKWDLKADGETAVQDMNIEFVRGCTSKTLFDMIVYNEADAT